MWSYFLPILLATSAFSAGPPRKKIFDLVQEETPIKPFVDPVDGIFYRLPNDTVPLHYDVSLKTDVHAGDFAFTGKVEILFEVLFATSQIVLHQRQLTIAIVEFYDVSGTLIQENMVFSIDAVREFLVIIAPRILLVGEQFRLSIEYSGILREDEAGFYRSSYVNEEGQTAWLATTQFQATDARHGFPCWDEPAIRSTFSIEIEHHNSYTALSNMPVESRTDISATHVITKFLTTPKIQTYLIAYVISDFISVQKLNIRIPQRVFATREQINDGQGDFALEFGVKNLEAFERYLRVEYMLPKMDQISIPDFAAGAMENFGLVTYYEAYLLYNSKIHTAGRKVTVAEIVSHEYAHQWFGNQVSAAWWSYLWLNEGFATLFESYATGLVYPEWREMEMFVVFTVHGVFQSDASNQARAMTHYVESPENIDNLFDDVAYWKSGAVLRMLQTMMTDVVFARGLSLYLNEFKEKAATPEDLYRNLQTAIDNELLEQTPNIAAFMKTWELQPGFPVINVARNGDVISIVQERYFTNSLAGNDASIWSIPLNYIVGSNPDYSKTTMDFMMTDKSYTLNNGSAPNGKSWTNDDWILFNIQETGYYRVNYDMNLWKLLSDELTKGDHTKLHPLNRAQLIDDSFNLARTQRLPYSVAFDIIAYLKFEDDYIPWVAANRALNFLHPYLMGSQFYDHFQSLIQYDSDLFYTRLGVNSIENEPLLDKFARNIAINWACMMNHAQCLLDTSALMVQVSRDEHTVEPDLETVIYCNGLRAASPITFNAMLNLVTSSPNHPKRDLIIRSLGCSHSSGLIKSYLESTLHPSSNFEDRLPIVTAVYTNGGYLGLSSVLDFLYVTDINVLKNTFGENTLLNLARTLSVRVSNSHQLHQVLDFMMSLYGEDIITVDLFLANIQAASARIHWIDDNVPAIEYWLRFNVLRVPPTLPPFPSQA